MNISVCECFVQEKNRLALDHVLDTQQNKHSQLELRWADSWCVFSYSSWNRGKWISSSHSCHSTLLNVAINFLVALCCFDVFLYSLCKSVTSGFKKVSDDSRLKRNLVRTTIEMDKELIMQYENGFSDLTTKVVWENLQSLLY